jgi:dCTP deaminase
VILTGPEILEAVKSGDIEIDPFVREHVNPASFDLTLGDEVLQYVLPGVVRFMGQHKIYEHRSFLDSKIENDYVRTFLSDGLILEPGNLYLMHTVERVMAKRFVCVLDGKSSLGRLGVSIHQTAGYGDCGFNGQYTMEVTCVLPVRLYAGMRVAQIRFHTVRGVVAKYDGNYVGDRAKGPVPSMSWRQFK